MGHRGTGDHAYNENGGISITFTGHEKLPSGTPSGEAEGKPGKGHPGEIPEVQ